MGFQGPEPQRYRVSVDVATRTHRYGHPHLRNIRAAVTLLVQFPPGGSGHAGQRSCLRARRTGTQSPSVGALDTSGTCLLHAARVFDASILLAPTVCRGLAAEKSISTTAKRHPLSLSLLWCISTPLQRYVARPKLWRGRKFHFRAYALLRADMSAWLYRTAYILSASRPYHLRTNSDGGGGLGAAAEVGNAQAAGFADELVHISNLAVNKHTEGHPGQVGVRKTSAARGRLRACRQKHVVWSYHKCVWLVVALVN